ncbi:MAG: MFS transporter [Kiritimatiellae bacterium]|nr:MFS transporter [Kiritimatiellia bacterium]
MSTLETSAVAEKKSSNLIAIVTMFALYAMCGFMTYLAAPAGKIWGGNSVIANSTTLGMMGNMMNFLAYLIMGYPMGMVLQKFGYKTTALLATGSGALGILVQLLSGQVDPGTIGGIPAAWYIYLFGAFISGTSNCLLNGVINPMLNSIVGGGNRGNQLNLAGGACNSMFQGAAMVVVPAVVGEVTKDTKFSEVTGVLLAAAAIFIAATVIIAFLPIKNPVQRAKNIVYERSALAFRHCLLGVIGIFLYMGVEAGIPAATSSTQVKDLMGGGDSAAVIAGVLGGAVFVFMLCGRMLGAAFGAKVSARTMLLWASGISLALLAVGVALIACDVTVPYEVAGKGGAAATTVKVPVGAFCFVLMGLCTSVMWSVIFNLSTEGVGKYTEQASGLFMTMVVGGGVIPLVQSYLMDKASFTVSFVVPAFCLAYLFVYALAFSKNVNPEIKID